jgi:DNA-binding NtrC family response regulator
MSETILIVERDAPARRTLGQRLSGLDLDIVEADGVGTAREIIAGREIDVLVLDLASLGEAGLQLLTLAREFHPRAETILLSRPGQVPLSMKGMKLGAYGDIVVPVDVGILRSSIEAALQRVRLRSSAKRRSRKRGRDSMEDFKVLLVDDEEDFLESLNERLKLRKVDAETAHNGEEALERIGAGEQTVVVLDLKMPGMHGLEVLKRLKKANPDVQVVILTGHGSEEDRKEAERLGAFAYLTKPVRMDTLMKSLRGAYKRFRRLKQTVDTALMASAMAQAGEVDMARELMEEEDERQKKQQEE